MLQISVEVTNLNHAQREALAGFILTFPASNVSEENNAQVDEVTTLSGFETSDEGESELEAEGYFDLPVTAEQAFSVPQAPPAPLALVQVTAKGELDKNGLPWNERIHSSSRAINDDGSWRYKRGADKALVAQVEVELKALVAIPVKSAEVIVPPPPPAVSTTSVVPPPPAPGVLGMLLHPEEVQKFDAMTFPPPPPTDPALTALLAAAEYVTLPGGRTVDIAPPPPPPPVPINTFVALVKKVTAAKAAGTLTLESLQSTISVFGLKDFGALANHLDMVPAVEAALAL